MTQGKIHVDSFLKRDTVSCPASLSGQSGSLRFLVRAVHVTRVVLFEVEKNNKIVLRTQDPTEAIEYYNDELEKMTKIRKKHRDPVVLRRDDQ